MERHGIIRLIIIFEKGDWKLFRTIEIHYLA